MQSGEWIEINGRYYRLGGVLSTSAGSYGQVWEAADATGRAVAVKLINTEAMTQVDPTLHGHWRAHLEREIAFLDDLNADQSRHVVALLDHGEVDGQPALVLERLQANLGQWLAQQRREGAPPPDLAQVLDWAEQVLDGLDVVHQAGFVYRDLKFSNLLVGEDGARLKLADFGSLKRVDGDNTLSFIGTPATMAPEQVLPAHQGTEGCEYAVDYRADYYALGLLLFALLADRPTTVAQRRLGQLLALHGQEGASQQGAQLGGLDDEERDLLRHAIEFWTVPTRPEQGGGAAALLADLIDRLLARDPVSRPANSLEIRMVLDAARVSQPVAPALTPDWSAPPPADEPPNWHPRRGDRPTPPSRRRWVLLAGALGLAGAVAWAIVRPVTEIGPDQAEPLSAVIAPSTTESAKAAEPITPALEPIASSGSSAAISAPAPAPEPTAPPSPADAASLASPKSPATVDAPVAERPAPVDDAPVAERPGPVDDAPVVEMTGPVDDAPVAEMTGPVDDAPVAEMPEPVDDAPVAERPGPVDDAPVVEAPAPRKATPPVRLAPAKPRPAGEPASKPRPPAHVATPAAVEARPPVRAKPSGNAKSGKPAPAPAVAADRPATVERTSASARPATPERPAVEERPAAAPATPRIAKPTPPSSAPAAPEPPRRPPVAVKAAAPAPTDVRSSRQISRSKPTPSIASRAPATKKPDSKSSGPIARAKPTSRIASRPNPAPALPPIKLEARPDPALALPPIKLESRAQSAPPAPPPIELVSRSSAAATTTRPASVSNMARTQSKPQPRPNASPSPARSTDPITQLRDNAGRTAASFGDWASRTSSVVGKEVKRGLEAADQTVGQWTGRCNRADGCGRNTTQVERRDRWTSPRGGTITQREPPARYDEDEGFAKPPPR